MTSEPDSRDTSVQNGLTKVVEPTDEIEPTLPDVAEMPLGHEQIPSVTPT